MENYNRLEIGNNSVILIANTEKSKDYFFNGKVLSVYIENSDELLIIISLSSANGIEKKRHIYNKIENIPVSDYSRLVFEYNKIEKDIVLNVVIQ